MKLNQNIAIELATKHVESLGFTEIKPIPSARYISEDYLQKLANESEGLGISIDLEHDHPRWIVEFSFEETSEYIDSPNSLLVEVYSENNIQIMESL